ncbi:MAG: hypothetical protein M1839_002757 [Geoglossum umbratile]|nr:MAG: hypothetical protein M1839_002757 [Geoglossum umbratile]
MASVFSRLFSAVTGASPPPQSNKRNHNVMHQSYPPSFRYPEFPLASSAHEEAPEIPTADVFWPETALLPSEDYLPTLAQCAVHLELLECFHTLKEKVMNDEQIGHWLGVPSDFHPHAGAVERGQQRQEVIEVQNERIWQTFLELAVQRFQTWWLIDGILEPGNRRPSKAAILRKDIGELGVRVDVGILEMAADKLPPLDVLMVWHAYMLNPRNFWQDCSYFGQEALWKTALPWNHIHSAINNKTWMYTVVPAAETNFTTNTGLAWDLQDMIQRSATNGNDKALTPDLSVHCPYCSVLNKKIPLVGKGQNGDHNCGWTDNPSDEEHSSMDGWRCEVCERMFNRDNLAARKWKDDAAKFLEKGVRLPGMYMKSDGPSRQEKHSWLFRFLHVLLHESCSQRKPLAQLSTLQDIENYLISCAESNDFRSGPARSMNLPEKIASTKWANAISACLENYRDNPGRFSLDLRHAVTRQSGFVAKMHTLLWIRAPCLPHMLSKYLDRYKRFIYLLGSEGGRNLVPTLDIDLIWHTHQLCPPFYNFLMLRDTGRFVNHDDRIVPDKLNTDFQRCKELWMETFGEEYGWCLCWQCEQYSAALTRLVERLPEERPSHGVLMTSEGATGGWREQVLSDQRRRVEALQGLSEKEYAAFVGDVRITTKWYRDVEIGRQVRLRGERAPYLSRDGLKEVREGLMLNAGG